MSSNTWIDSVDSDVFFVEQISNEPSPQRNNSPNILNSTEISHTQTAGMPSVSSIAAPEPQILTIHDNSNEPTMPYGFAQQIPIIPPSLNDLNLPPNSFNILATMAVLNYTHDGNNDNYSPQSPEPSEPRKVIYRRNESTVIIIYIVAFRYCTIYKITWRFVFIETLFPHINRRSTLLFKDKDQTSVFIADKTFPLV